jgi:hypothetical protein
MMVNIDNVVGGLFVHEHSVTGDPYLFEFIIGVEEIDGYNHYHELTIMIPRIDPKFAFTIFRSYPRGRRIA